MNSIVRRSLCLLLLLAAAAGSGCTANPAYACDCTPATTQDSANGCLVRTCLATCFWGPYLLKTGNTCSTGVSRRSCIPNPPGCKKATGIQECTACKWQACECR